jgi:hypothetical protein
MNIQRLKTTHSLILTAAVFCITLYKTQCNAETWILEDFPYANGPLTTQAASNWLHTSGSDQQIQIIDSMLFLTEKDSEDAVIEIPGGPIAIDTGLPLYVAFDLTVNARPSGNGNYFAHLRGSSPSTFRGRIFIIPGGDGENEQFELGVSSGGSAANDAIKYPDSFETRLAYKIILKYTVSTGTTQLWVNPASEDSNSVTTIDTPSPRDIVGFAVRQSLSSGNGIGSLTVDNLVIASTFQEANTGSPATTPPSVEPTEPTEPHLISISSAAASPLIDEGLGTIEFRFSRTSGLEEPLSISVSAAGDIIQGEDIEPLPASIEFGPWKQPHPSQFRSLTTTK